jgi:hypothetical protein
MKFISFALKTYIIIGTIVYMITLFSYLIGPFLISDASLFEKFVASIPASFLGMISIYRIVLWGPGLFVWWLQMSEPGHVAFLQWLAPGFFIQAIPK